MGWQDDIENNRFEIITGDKKSYYPKWRLASKSQEYNTTIFDFIGVEGSLVDRRKAKARKFDLAIFFDGENAVQLGNDFEISARDLRKWTMKHPYYGEIICHPISLVQNNDILNVTAFNITVIETLLEGWPKGMTDNIDALQQITNTDILNTFSKISTVDKTSLKTSVNRFDTIFSKKIINTDQLLQFKKKISDSIIELDKAEFSIVDSIRSIQAIIVYPATITQTLKERFNILKEAMVDLFNNIEGTIFGKIKCELLAGNIISSMAVTSTNNDFQTRKEINDFQNSLVDAYNLYISFLDSIQTDRADTNSSFTPDFTVLNSLDILINNALLNLNDLLFTSKQEREYICEKDTNLILLTHKLLGLDADDNNLMTFKKINNIGLNEIFAIRKNRKVIYYV